MAGGCCRRGYRRELCEIYEALTSRRELWSKDLYLNSDGRRLFEVLLRLLLEEHPEHRRLVARARREPSWRMLARLAELSFYHCPPPETPPWLQTPYTTAPRQAPWPRPQGGDTAAPETGEAKPGREEAARKYKHAEVSPCAGK